MPSVHLFLVELRMPGVTEPELAMLQAALVDASSRLTARGEPVRCVRTVLLPDQHRLLCFFEAARPETVRTVNLAAQAPVCSIVAAIEVLPQAPGGAE